VLCALILPPPPLILIGVSKGAPAVQIVEALENRHWGPKRGHHVQEVSLPPQPGSAELARPPTDFPLG
jgi:hypothetical protein